MEHHLTTYITHDTLISALGFSTQENLEAIRAYHSGITCRRTNGLRTLPYWQLLSRKRDCNNRQKQQE